MLFLGEAEGGLTVTEESPGTGGVVSIRNTYEGDVGGFGLGPNIFLVTDDPASGGITNLGGQVSIYSANGSYFQASAVFGQQVDINVPRGTAVITLPAGQPHLGGNPYSDWSNDMLWPGGNPSASSPLSGDWAIAYAVNAIWGNHATSSETLNRELIHYSSNHPSNNGSNRSIVWYGGGMTAVAHGNAQRFTTYATATAWSPERNTIMQDTVGYYPRVPVVPTTKSIESKSAAEFATLAADGGQAASAISGSRVEINGEVLDINSQVTAGTRTDWSLTLPADPKIVYKNRWHYLSQWKYYYKLESLPRFVDVVVAGLTSRFGDSPVNVQYDSEEDRFVVANVSAAANSGFIRLNGDILSTNALGNVRVNTGRGDVRIENNSSIAFVVKDIYTGSNSGEQQSESRIEINDTLKEVQTIYVYDPATQLTATYVGGNTETSAAILSRGAVAESSGAIPYQPKENMRWQWFLYSVLERTRTSVTSSSGYHVGNWQFVSGDFRSGVSGNPWEYVASFEPYIAYNYFVQWKCRRLLIKRWVSRITTFWPPRKKYRGILGAVPFPCR